MAVRISGSFDTARPRAEVFTRLTQPAWVVEALDFPAPSEMRDDEAVVHGEVGFGPLHGHIEIHVRIVERDADRRAVYRGWGEGLGSKLDLEASFQLTDTATNGGTHVEWVGEADIRGPMAGIASGPFQPLSRRNFDHLQRALDADLVHPTSAT